MASHPTCGNCGYNLTAATGNRCPECGKLFIEAGVRLRPEPRPGRALRVVLVLSVGLAAVIGAMMAITATQRAQAAAMQAQAIAARAAAQRQFLAAQLAATQRTAATQPATAPSSSPR